MTATPVTLSPHITIARPVEALVVSSSAAGQSANAMVLLHNPYGFENRLRIDFAILHSQATYMR